MKVGVAGCHYAHRTSLQNVSYFLSHGEKDMHAPLLEPTLLREPEGTVHYVRQVWNQLSVNRGVEGV